MSSLNTDARLISTEYPFDVRINSTAGICVLQISVALSHMFIVIMDNTCLSTKLPLTNRRAEAFDLSTWLESSAAKENCIQGFQKMSSSFTAIIMLLSF